MGFFRGFARGRRQKLAEQVAKQQEKINKLRIEELTFKLGVASEQAKAQQRVLNPPPPEFGNLSVSGALAAREEQANPQGLIGGPDAPANASLSEIMARAQTGKVSDLVRSGLISEFQKLQQLQQGQTPEGLGVSQAPLSPEGKQAADIINFADKFGPDSPESKILRERFAPTDPVATFGDVARTRGQFMKLSEKNLVSLNAFDNINVLSQDATGAGDIGMIFSFMKLLDPGSRVTEGEVALAGQVGGEAGQLMNLYNRLVKGERLTSIARQDMLFQSAQIARNVIGKQQSNELEFRDIATRDKMDPRNVVLFSEQVRQTADSIEGIQKPDRSLSETVKRAEESLSFVDEARKTVADLISPSPDTPIEQMSLSEIGAVDTSNMSADELARVEARMKELGALQ
jgi:hypothetical protein